MECEGASNDGCPLLLMILDNFICLRQENYGCHVISRILFETIVIVVSMQVPEPAGAFWGCVVIAGAVVVGALAMAHQNGKIAQHMMTTMAQQGDRITNTCEMMTNTSERLATALAHHGDRLATTGERIASVAETIDVNVNFKQC